VALVERARKENASVVASIFVNPLQFGPNEDYAKYPRAFETDVAKFEEAGVDLLYAPSVERMYPPGFEAHVEMGELGRVFEGARRPGHFNGVATVVLKLLHAIEPTSLYLGQKDVQQTAVLRRMVRDLDLPTNIVVAPTVRESDGLARSSRNVYLSPEQRAAAPSIYRSLRAVERAFESGVNDVARARALGMAVLEPPLEWDYFEIVDPASFEILTNAGGPALVVAVARAGATRLLDNLPIAGADGIDPIVTPERVPVRSSLARSAFPLGLEP
jgi:pantoate--beta-alanine ligase